MPLPALHCRPVQAAVKMVMASDLSLRGGRRPTWQSHATGYVFAVAFLLSNRVLRDSHVASLLGMTRQGGAAVGTAYCIEFAVLLPLRGRERHAAPLQGFCTRRSATEPTASMAFTKRRYRCNWFVRFIVAPVSTTQKEAPIGRICFEPNSENAFSSVASCCSPRSSAALPPCCRPSCRSPGMALQPTAASCRSSTCMQSTRLSRTAAHWSGTSAKRTITLPRPEAVSRPIPIPARWGSPMRSPDD